MCKGVHCVDLGESFHVFFRRELSNAYFLAKFRFDTAENEPSKVCPIDEARDGLLAVPLAAWDVETLKQFRHEVTSAVCEIIFWSADEVSRFFFSRLPSGQKWWKRFENDKIRNDYAEKY